MEREIECWDQEDVEHLSYTDKDEAIEGILDGLDDVTTGELEICGYTRRKIKEVSIGFIAERVIENLLEDLDEEYGGEDNTDITDKMREDAKDFVQKIIAEYHVWQYEIVCKERVDIRKWIEANRPDWLVK